ncbi:hypothetical protein J5226_16320 [Lysobacter sp. K5869]|uniref:YggN family protein n=1 Tax=Lysobacter sp. K5869 TaxID=2820808 RepID=UPI001C060603|nr:YggN family protein [Lysobacter sp. K5869]QWP75184.1 hypothetical protein J5226_16320 [Lysobacter sp. K5869]
MTARKPSAALLLAVAFAAALAGGCSRKSDSDVHVVVIDHMSMAGDRLQVRGGGQRAEIGPDGAIAIDGKALALNPAQQAAGRAFYVEAVGIRSDGAAIGKAGAAMAGQVLSTVAQDLRSGHTDQTGSKVEAQAAKLEEQAMRICQRVGTLRVAQEQLVAQVPQFAPFARKNLTTGDECRSRS